MNCMCKKIKQGHPLATIPPICLTLQIPMLLFTPLKINKIPTSFLYLSFSIKLPLCSSLSALPLSLLSWQTHICLAVNQTG